MSHRRFALAAALASAALATPLAFPARAQEPRLPAHPRELEFPPLAFEPPGPDAHRLELANGVVAYLVPDPQLPAVRIRAYVRTGSLYDPPGKEGLAALTFGLMRSGGAGDLGPDELDAKLDDLAATIEGDAGESRATLEAWTRTKHLDEVLDLFMAVLRFPSFAEERFDHAREDAAAESESDEDDAGLVAARRLRKALLGEHPGARARTAESLGAITRDDVVAFHKHAVVPGRVVLAVSGAFDRPALERELGKRFADWRGKGKGWDPLPAVEERPAPPLLVVDRPDVSQSYVEIGARGLRSGDPMIPALVIADHVFGSGSFTSRAVVRVRSDEGLAYSVGSDFELGPVVPGIVRTYFQCRSSETSYALALVREEASKLIAQGPSADELAAAKNAVIGRFPARFTTAADVARALAEAELDGLPRDHDARWRDRIKAVTPEDVKAAAARFYAPDRTATVVVGPIAHARRSILHGTALDDFGPVQIELR